MANAILGFDPQLEALKEAEKARDAKLADWLKRDQSGEALKAFGNQIGDKTNEALVDSWARRVLSTSGTGSIRKALNVEAISIGSDGTKVEVHKDREFTPVEYETLSTQDVDSEGLSAKALPSTRTRLAGAVRASLEAKENQRLCLLFEKAVGTTGQIVEGHSVSMKSFFDAIGLIERTGSATSFISINRADRASVICDLEGFRDEDDPARRSVGVTGKFDGIDIVSAPSGLLDFVEEGCAWVTVVPSALGRLESIDYVFEPFRQLLELGPGEVRPLGWTISSRQRMAIWNPYGVAKIVFGKKSKRKL